MSHRMLVACALAAALIAPASAHAGSRPVITGTYAVGETLTCSDGTYDRTRETVTKRWFWSPATRGTGDTYTVQPSDIGHQIYCEVSNGTSAELSDPFPQLPRTQPDAAPAPPCAASTPSETTFDDPLGDNIGISHDITRLHVRMDDHCTLTLVADLGAGPASAPEMAVIWLDTDGDSATGGSHGDDVSLILFNLGGSPIAGFARWNPKTAQFDNGKDFPVQQFDAHGIVFSVPVAELGVVPGVTAHLAFSVGTANNSDEAPAYTGPWNGFTIAYTSVAPVTPVITTPPVVSLAKPALVKAPSITRKGSRLTCSPGTWSGSPKLAYAWKRDGKTLKHQTKSRYTLRRADRGHRFACTVTARNAAGNRTSTTRALHVK